MVSLFLKRKQRSNQKRMHTHRLVYEAAGTVRSLPLRHGARGGVARTWNDHSRAPAVKERENEMLRFKDFEDS